MRNKITQINIAHPDFIPNFLILLAFILMDAFWLLSLSRWGISYGPRKLPFILFFIFRIGLFVLWFVLQGRLFKVSVNPPNLSFFSFLVTNLLVLVFGIYGFCIEPFQLTQSHLEISVAGLSRPVRIIQLSDIHVEYITRREQELVTLIESLHPDLIVMTGDYTSEDFTNDPVTFQDLRQFISQLHVPLGIYAVNGNSESVYVMDLLFADTGIHLLDNEVVRIPELGDHMAILGLSYFNELIDEVNLTRLMSQVQPEDYTILLYHKPDLAYAARDLKVNLYLCGHTHGGQVRLPIFGALITNSRYGKTFEMGLYSLDQMTLFVSRGLGFTSGSAPRIRFLAPPEVVVIDLVPKELPAGP
jgi:predicted MPP superfamily phosphohydrolase